MENLQETSEINHTSLSEEELLNPLKAIFNFFDATSHEYLRKELWELLKAALSNNCWTFMSEPGTALDVKKKLENLLDAFHLLLKTKEEQDGEILETYPIGSKEQIKKERDELFQVYNVINEHRGRIKRLTKMEIEQPYLAIKALFLHHDLEEWKVILAEGSEYALSKMTLLDVINENLLLDLEHLEKMLEVAYLLNKANKKHDQDNNFMVQLVKDLNRETVHNFTLKLLNEFVCFIGTVPAERLNRNLRKIFMDYLSFNIDGLPVDFKDHLFDLERLHHLLDMIDKEKRKGMREEENHG